MKRSGLLVYRGFRGSDNTYNPKLKQFPLSEDHLVEWIDQANHKHIAINDGISRGAVEELIAVLIKLSFFTLAVSLFHSHSVFSLYSSTCIFFFISSYRGGVVYKSRIDFS